MKVIKSPLPERIAAALVAPAMPSQDLERLLEEVSESLPGARSEAQKAEALALDPVLTGTQAQQAAASAQTAAFAVRRLETALSYLEKRLAERQTEEAESVKWAAYREVEKRRDVVATRISEEYPALAAGLADLIRAALDSAIEVDKINGNLPTDAQPLDRPDGKARGFTDNGRDGIKGSLYGPVRLAEAVIPSATDFEWCAWPPNMRADRLHGGAPLSYHDALNRYRMERERSAA